MIGLVTSIIKFATECMKSLFTTVSAIGQLIVIVTTGITSLLLTTFESIVKFFQIIYEDNIFIFTEELPSILNNAKNSLKLQWLSFENRFINVYDSVYSYFESVIDSITWSISATCTIIVEVILLLKKACLLIGDTAWLLLTFIPVQLPLLMRTIWTTITNVAKAIAVDTYMILLELTNFLTDVPLQSFLGLVSIITIVRLFVHFREIICAYAGDFYWSTVRKFLYFYYVLYNYFVDSEARVITRIAGNHTSQLREMVSEALEEAEDIDNPAESLCVVCQERHKCVLILPCRHVCLCRECCTRLYNYQRKCPICRTFIFHSVNIYL